MPIGAKIRRATPDLAPGESAPGMVPDGPTPAMPTPIPATASQIFMRVVRRIGKGLAPGTVLASAILLSAGIASAQHGQHQPTETTGAHGTESHGTGHHGTGHQSGPSAGGHSTGGHSTGGHAAGGHGGGHRPAAEETGLRHLKPTHKSQPPAPHGHQAASATEAQRAAQAAILQELTAGNTRFVAGKTHHHTPRPGVRRRLAAEHRPEILVIASDDSRVVPEAVFDLAPGRIVAVRTPGLIADPSTLGLVERTVARLGVRTVVLLADDGTGPLADVLAGTGDSPATAPWRRQMAPALRAMGNPGSTMGTLPDAKGTTALREETAHIARTALLRGSPILRDLASLGKLTLHPARYHVGTGSVEWLPERPLGDLDGTVGSDADPLGDLRGPPPHTALQMLIAGNRRFIAGTTTRADLSKDRRTDLAHGAMPFGIALAPADLVFSPELLFDLGLGELRTVRTPAGAATPSAIAGVDWATRQGGVGIITVLLERNHWSILAALQEEVHPAGPGHPMSPNYMATLNHLKDAVREAKAKRPHGEEQELRDLVAELAAQQLVRELRVRSSWVVRQEHNGTLMVVAGVIDPAAGEVRWLPDPAEANEIHAAPMGETHHGHGEDDHHGTGGHGSVHHGAEGHDPGHHESDHHETGHHKSGHETEHHVGHGDTHGGDHATTHGSGHSTDDSTGHATDHTGHTPSDSHGHAGEHHGETHGGHSDRGLFAETDHGHGEDGWKFGGGHSSHGDEGHGHGTHGETSHGSSEAGHLGDGHSDHGHSANGHATDDHSDHGHSAHGDTAHSSGAPIHHKSHPSGFEVPHGAHDEHGSHAETGHFGDGHGDAHGDGHGHSHGASPTGWVIAFGGFSFLVGAALLAFYALQARKAALPAPAENAEAAAKGSS